MVIPICRITNGGCGHKTLIVIVVVIENLHEPVVQTESPNCTYHEENLCVIMEDFSVAKKQGFMSLDSAPPGQYRTFWG
jgi:hypothetical protein